MSEDYWEGALYIYDADITNGAGGAGANSYNLTPGVGNEMEILSIRFLNGDVAGRVLTVEIRDDDNNVIIEIFPGVSLGAGATIMFPHISSDANIAARSAWPNKTRAFLAGEMNVNLSLAAVAASQNTECSIVGRIRGGIPTATEVGASTPTINVNKEQVF